jgi:radical SAM superfamily enzyme YgiQ (UPF0313 family)
MKVLLINIFRSQRELGGDYQRVLAPMPPITLAYLVAALESADIDVEVYDDSLAAGDEAELERCLKRVCPDVVGLSLVTATMAGTPRIVESIRKHVPGARIVAGNLHAEVFKDALLRQGMVDVVVIGEGEITFVELVRALERGSPSLDGIQGLSFLEGGRVVTTPPRPRIADLDSLPFPAWHKFPMERYRILSFARVKDPGILILGSRGCPFNCSYCSLRVMGNVRRKRSAVNIADECEHVYEKFGILQPSFVDPIFPLGKKEGLDYAAELIRRGLHKRQVWITETRTDLVDLELLQALRESGLRRLMFGFEAGDAEELDTLHKGASLDHAIKAVEMCRKAGIETVGFFMLGVPGASRESMQRNIQFAKTLDLDFAKYTVFTPYPGTPLYEQLLSERKLLAPEDWKRYTTYPCNDVPPVYVPDGFTAQEIIALQARAHLSFYLRPKMIVRQLFQLRTLSFADISDALRTIAAVALQKGVGASTQSSISG